jgi:hypothetical protein
VRDGGRGRPRRGGGAVDQGRMIVLGSHIRQQRLPDQGGGDAHHDEGVLFHVEGSRPAQQQQQ